MKTFKELVDLFRGVRTDEENIDELAPVKKRIDKSSEAKARRLKAKKDYRKDKAKIAIQRKKRRQSEAMMTDQFKTFTVSINNTGDLRQMYRFIDNLPVRDSRFLRTTYNKLSPALNLKHDFVCPECDHEQEVEVPITAQFFWPDA